MSREFLNQNLVKFTFSDGKIYYISKKTINNVPNSRFTRLIKKNPKINSFQIKNNSTYFIFIYHYMVNPHKVEFVNRLTKSHLLKLTYDTILYDMRDLYSLIYNRYREKYIACNINCCEYCNNNLNLTNLRIYKNKRICSRCYGEKKSDENTNTKDEYLYIYDLNRNYE